MHAILTNIPLTSWNRDSKGSITKIVLTKRLEISSSLKWKHYKPGLGLWGMGTTSEKECGRSPTKYSIELVMTNDKEGEEDGEEDGDEEGDAPMH